MKPLYAENKRVSRCPCCQTKYSKSKLSTKIGNSSARKSSKRLIAKEVQNA